MSSKLEKIKFKESQLAPASRQVDALLLLPGNSTWKLTSNEIISNFRNLYKRSKEKREKNSYKEDIKERFNRNRDHSIIAKGWVKWDDDLNVEFTLDTNGKGAIKFHKVLNIVIKVLFGMVVLLAFLDHTFLHHFQSKSFTDSFINFSKSALLNEIFFYSILLVSLLAFVMCVVDMTYPMLGKGIIQFKGKEIVDHGKYTSIVSEYNQCVVKFKEPDDVLSVIPDFKKTISTYFYLFGCFLMDYIFIIFFGYFFFIYYLGDSNLQLTFGWTFLSLFASNFISYHVINNVKKQLNIKLPSKITPEPEIGTINS